jgi:hypothetical protein
MKYVLARICQRPHKDNEECNELSYLEDKDGKLEFNSKADAVEYKLDLIEGELGEGSDYTQEELENEIMIIPSEEAQ